MIIYPAIDVKDGQCVRLRQGNYDDVTVYSRDPADIAMRWERLGARALHVVDLDGAREGRPMNIAVISEMAVNVTIPIQVGGGIRDIETIEIVLNKSIQRVILGTSAVSDPDFVREALRIFQDSIVIGIDALDGMVRVEGWRKEGGMTAVELARRMEEFGARTIIYTDISKDGMLMGVNAEAVREMAETVRCDVIASGGITSLEDIRKLKKAKAAGVIIGKALYTGDIRFREAMRTAEEEE